MTAELKTFPSPEDLLSFVNDLYGAGSTVVTVTVLMKSVYLIQHD
jgi:hypothetical protein